MRKSFMAMSVMFVLVIALVLPTLAQEGAPAMEMPPLPGEVVLENVAAPRGLAFDADGNLIVALAGSGGDLPLGESPDGATTMAGMSGSIVSIDADGVVTDIMTGIPSFQGPMEATGVYRVIPHNGKLWIVTSAALGTVYGNSIVEYDPVTRLIGTTINVGAFEAENNPDGNEIDSNVADIAWDADGLMYIVDAGANTLYTWTQADGLTGIVSWPENSVPDSIEIADNGDIYIGHLGTGLAPGGAKVEHWSNGEVVKTFAGLTSVTDILLTSDGQLYAVELINFGEQGPGPGRVISLPEDGEATAVAEGLIAPFALAEGPDGAIYVSYGTIPFAPGMMGGVIRLDISGM